MNPTQIPTEVTEVTPAITLRRAALYLQRYGWTQECYYHRAPGALLPAADAAGAIGMVVFGQDHAEPFRRDLPNWPQFFAAHLALADYISLNDVFWNEEDDLTTVQDWNDRYDRTADQVIAAFLAAADEWDAEHPGGAR